MRQSLALGDCVLLGYRMAYLLGRVLLIRAHDDGLALRLLLREYDVILGRVVVGVALVLDFVVGKGCLIDWLVVLGSIATLAWGRLEPLHSGGLLFAPQVPARRRVHGWGLGEGELTLRALPFDRGHAIVEVVSRVDVLCALTVIGTSTIPLSVGQLNLLLLSLEGTLLGG